ncbi:efflux RND transporter periplasmic adaptor subunit [Saccharicrinis carchari]|nr:efflux RND transporter periplasmic adaptor subunit [Saccharicrinis carchari]
MTKRILQSLIILLTVGIGFSACGTEKPTEVPKARYVKVEKINMGIDNKEIVFHGQLKEKRDVNVAFKVGGDVYEVLASEGDYVKEGQVIARVNPRDYKIKLQSASAQYKHAKGEYARYKELYKKNKLPINTLESLEAAYLSTKSAYESAQNALDDTELKAPFDGYIYRKHIDKAENVTPGKPIYSLLDVSHLEVRFSLPESKVNLASEFEKISCDIPNAKMYNMPARLLSVNEKSNGNDMFDVRLQVDNDKLNSLKPGMSVAIKIKMPAVAEPTLNVPVESVFYKNGKAYVWILNPEDSVVLSQEVKIKEFENKGYLSVMAGLRGDEYVVTAGVHSLSENQSVKKL